MQALFLAPFFCICALDSAVLQHLDRRKEDQGSLRLTEMFTSPAGGFSALPGPNTAHILLQEE